MACDRYIKLLTSVLEWQQKQDSLTNNNDNMTCNNNNTAVAVKVEPLHWGASAAGPLPGARVNASAMTVRPAATRPQSRPAPAAALQCQCRCAPSCLAAAARPGAPGPRGPAAGPRCRRAGLGVGLGVGRHQDSDELVREALGGPAAQRVPGPEAAAPARRPAQVRVRVPPRPTTHEA